MRRLFTVLLLMYVPNGTPGILIGLLIYTCTFWAGYTLECRPFESKQRNYQEAFNNICFSFMLCLCFMFTPFCTDEKAREGLGEVFNYLFYVMLGVNISLQLVSTVRSIIRKYRTWFYKRRNDKIIKGRLDKKLELEERDRVARMKARMK